MHHSEVSSGYGCQVLLSAGEEAEDCCPLQTEAQSLVSAGHHRRRLDGVV